MARKVNMLTFLLVLALFALALAAPPAITPYPTTDDTRFTWLGRIARSLGNASGVSIDLEGTALLFTVANATFIGLTINDRTKGGARLGVYFDSENHTASSASLPADPNPSGGALPPTARVATLITSPAQTLYTLGSGDQIRGRGPNGALRVRVELLTEWSHLGDGGVDSLFTVASVLTDGVVAPAPPQPTRRLLVLGDSLSSGPGAGFTVPPSGAPCGDGVLLNDWGYTWNALLCRNFSAACEVIAQSGATITGTAYNIPMSLPWALGAMGARGWVGERVPWEMRVDGVFIELGENDCHAFNCTSGEGRGKLADAYVALAQKLAAAQPAGVALPLWFTLSNHEAGQSAAMADAVVALQGQGFKHAALLNGTTPNNDPCTGAPIDNGCAGHPSAAQNALAFARMRPIVAAALGW